MKQTKNKLKNEKDFDLNQKLRIVKRKYTPFKVSLKYGDFDIAYREVNVSPYIDTKSIDFNLTTEVDIFDFFGDYNSKTDENQNKLVNGLLNILSYYNQEENEIDILKILYQSTKYVLTHKTHYEDINFINNHVKWLEELINKSEEKPEKLTFVITIDKKRVREYYLPLENVKNFTFKKLYSVEMKQVMDMIIDLFMENFYVRQIELIDIAYKLMNNLNLTVRKDFEGDRTTYNILKTAKLKPEVYREFRDKIKNGEKFTPSDRDKFYSNTD